MKKSKKIIIGMFITAFLFFIISIIVSFMTTPSKKYKDNVYCSQYGMCYTYDGLYLMYYEDEDESEDNYLDYLQYKCIYTRLLNTCQEKILTWDNNKMYVKNNGKDYVNGYYNVNVDLGKRDNLDLTNKTYKNKNLELYFTDKNNVIISGPNNTQQKCNYRITAYDFDEYTTISYECPNKAYDKDDNYNSYTFDIKKDVIITFKKISKSKLKYIDFKYYDKDYNYIINDSLYKNGHYKLNEEEAKTENLPEEIWINNKTIRSQKKSYISDDYILSTNTLEIKQYNDKYIQYDYKTNSNTIYYDLEKETLCSYKICYEKVD